MSYLDDPEHDWWLDPSEPRTPHYNICEMADKLTNDEIRIVLLGYEGLRLRHPSASVDSCLETSLIWMLG